MVAPGGVSNIQHAFTTSSLDVTWDPLAEADGYVATLLLDDVQVASQDVATATASFTGLEDGTTYTLSLYAYNADGDGPIGYYQATTGYIAPAAPVNLRQFEERIIAVICRWDHPEPEKVHDTEVQLLYGDELVMTDAFDGPETERTFVVPMASTDYLLRVRAGNPGGWSEWAEATVHSENFPLIDSRLGVMGATYLEDVLHPDTWDGGTDLSGVGDSQSVNAGVEFEFSALSRLKLPIEAPFLDASLTIQPITSRMVMKSYAADTEANYLDLAVAIDPISSRSVQINHDAGHDSDYLDVLVSIPIIDSYQALFKYADDEDAFLSLSVDIPAFSSYVP